MSITDTLKDNASFDLISWIECTIILGSQTHARMHARFCWRKGNVISSEKNCASLWFRWWYCTMCTNALFFPVFFRLLNQQFIDNVTTEITESVLEKERKRPWQPYLLWGKEQQLLALCSLHGYQKWLGRHNLLLTGYSPTWYTDFQ